MEAEARERAEGAVAALERDLGAEREELRRLIAVERQREWINRRSGPSLYTDEQERVLEGLYQVDKRPDGELIPRIANQLGLEPSSVEIWFRQRRVTEKRERHRFFAIVSLLTLFVLISIAFYIYYGVVRASGVKYKTKRVRRKPPKY